MPIYRVKDWRVKYENSRTRQLVRMDWVPVPNKMDGDGYTELIDHPNGAAHFGCWIALVEIASKCEKRGLLTREGNKPHTPTSLSRISRIPASVLAEAIPRLMHIGWLEDALLVDKPNEMTDLSLPVTDPSLPVTTKPQGDGPVTDDDYGMEGNGMERNGTEPAGGLPKVQSIKPNPIYELRKAYHHGNRPTTDRDWQYGATAMLSANVTDEEVLNEIIPWVQKELAVSNFPRKFYSPQSLFELDLKPWRTRDPPAVTTSQFLSKSERDDLAAQQEFERLMAKKNDTTNQKSLS